MTAGIDPGQETRTRRRLVLLSALGLVLLVSWLVSAPPGLLGKSDAVAYAVCHRIPSHSHYLAERPFSLCARCTGQYLGFLWGFGYQLARAKRRSGFPKKPFLLWLGSLLLLYFIDGVNSVLNLYPGLARFALYPPDNLLRLFTGLGMGLVVSAILYPLANQAIWKESSPQPALADLRDWSWFLAGGLAAGGLILTANPLILYPLILLSTAGLLLLLTVLYTVIWILIRRRENSFHSWQELWGWGLAGSISALLQIMAVDAIRFLLTGTWSGFLDY